MMKSKHLGLIRVQKNPNRLWLTFMWCHQQVDSLLRQVGPNFVYLSLQVNVAQTLRQDP